MNFEQFKDLSILYVEDDSITRIMFTKIFEKFFKDVFSAEDGAEGIELFKQHNPDIVVTDLAMPEMNGFQLIDEIRREDEDIIIIVTTAYREEAEHAEGATGVIFKPMEKNEALECIAQFIDK